MERKDYFETALLHKKKLKNISCALFDVDGILTDGKIFFSSESLGWNRFFHAHDGYGFKLLAELGVKVGILSGGDSLGVRERFINNLSLSEKMVKLGEEDKEKSYDLVKSDLKLSDEEILYMGDELFDMPALRRAGFSATVPEANYEVKEVCDYITKKNAGCGAAREVMDILKIVLTNQV